MKKIISFLLIFAFLGTQVYAEPCRLSNDKLAVSLASDPEINPVRSDAIREGIAKTTEPGAIGNGAPLLELAQGKLPPAVILPAQEYQEIDQKLSEAAALAIALYTSNKANIPQAHQDRAEKALINLTKLQNHLPGNIYLYNADIRGPKDYLLGFNYKNHRGLAIDFIRWIYTRYSPDKARLRLAQYIYHECVPEKGLITERTDHRIIYNEIQYSVFGRQEVDGLKEDLRNFISDKVAVGHFDIDEREYVTTTAHAPPYTTIGGLQFGTDFMHAIYYSTGAGYTWGKEDPNDYRYTRFNLGGSEEGKIGKFLYIKDTETGEFWSVASLPVTSVEFEKYECRLGFGYIKITSKYKGIVVEQRIFIPLEKGAPEIQSVAVKNTSDKKRKLELYTYTEFPSGTPAQEAQMPQNMEYVNMTGVDEKDSRIVECNTFWRRNIPGESSKDRDVIFVAASKKPDDTETSLKNFEGARGSLENPLRVRKSTVGAPQSRGETGIASQKFTVTLDAGEENTLNFILAAAADQEKCRELTREWLDQGGKNIEDAFAALRKYRADLLAQFSCAIPDSEAQIMANTWGPIQVYANWLFSRSVGSRASGQSRGLGTRDSWQDILGYTYLLPDKARARIINMMTATHLQNGDALHSFNPRTGTPMEGQGFSDDHLWAIMAVAAYIRETGDFDILKVEIPYADNQSVKDNLYIHLLKSVEFTYNKLGPHGIPLILRADWNDTTQLVYKDWHVRGVTRENLAAKLKESESESVMVGEMLVLMAKEMREISQRIDHADKTKIINRMEEIAGKISDNINRYAWDQENGYYIAGSDDEGRPYGTAKEKEGSIYLLPQVWAVISGVASPQRAKSCMENVKQKLLRNGGLLLFWPAYNRTSAPRGAGNWYLPFWKENGSCFCHAAAMGLTALLMEGSGNDAYRALRANLPPAASRKDPMGYSATPYTWPQVINGEDGEFGAGGDWLTGAAAWNVRAMQQFMLGVRPEYDGLVIEPCIPSGWKGFTVTRVFRGATYEITVENPYGATRGVRSIEVDGKRIKGNIVPLFNNGIHKVKVVMFDDEALAEKNLQEALNYIEQNSSDRFSGAERKEIKDILTKLYWDALPYFRIGKKDNPIYHNTQVLYNMVRIALGEGLGYKEFKNAAILALLHDAGNALCSTLKVKESQIRERLKAGDMTGAGNLAMQSINFRKEHMEKAPQVIKAVAQGLIRDNSLETGDVDLICKVATMHDFPSVEKVMRHLRKLGVKLESEPGAFLFDFDTTPSGRLVTLLREADRLFMISHQGVVKDLLDDGKEPTPENIRSKLAANQNSHREEYNIYRECGKDDGKFISQTLYRTKTGYGLFDEYARGCERLISAWPAVNTMDEIKKALQIMDGIIPKQLAEGRTYKIRYDGARLRAYQADANLSKDNSPEKLLIEYIECLRARTAQDKKAEDVFDLKEFNGKTPEGESLIAVTCYDAKGMVVGEGNVNIKDLDKETTIQMIAMLNIAFAASHIPADSNLIEYNNLVSYIQNQYKEITGSELSPEDIRRIIALPNIKIIPADRLEEYYRLTIIQLRQAA